MKPGPKAEARAAGQKRYHGSICTLHPERMGERLASNGNCLGCNKDKMRARRAANPEYHRRATRVAYEKWYPKNRERVLASQRKRRTGVDGETYNALWRLQCGKCALCFADLKTGRAHADHCHDSGVTRGILCGPCNQAEGLIKRSGLSVLEFSKRLAEYLTNPPAKRLLQ